MSKKQQAQHDAETIARANAYIDDQLATMARFGSAPALSPERRAKLLADVLKATPRPRAAQ